MSSAIMFSEIQTILCSLLSTNQLSHFKQCKLLQALQKTSYNKPLCLCRPAFAAFPADRPARQRRALGAEGWREGGREGKRLILCPFPSPSLPPPLGWKHLLVAYKEGGWLTWLVSRHLLTRVQERRWNKFWLFFTQNVWNKLKLWFGLHCNLLYPLSSRLKACIFNTLLSMYAWRLL